MAIWAFQRRAPESSRRATTWLRYGGVYRHIQKSVTGLADAKLLKLMPKMRAFDDNIAEALCFFENLVIEAPLNREIHF